jgi:hypothetical protein
MPWQKGKRRSDESIARAVATRAARRTEREGTTAAAVPDEPRSARATAAPAPPTIRGDVTSAASPEYGEGDGIVVSLDAKGTARAVAGARGVVQSFEAVSGDYKVRFGKLVVRVAPQFVYRESAAGSRV